MVLFPNDAVQQKRSDLTLVPSNTDNCANYVNKLDNKGLSRLHNAASLAKPRVIRFLLELGADVSLRSNNHLTPLHYTATGYRPENCEEVYQSCKLLLENGANCNDADAEKSTAFHYTLAYTSLEIIKLLLEHGADINAVNSKGATAMHFAARNQNIGVMKFLHDQGLDVECTYDGLSPLHTAAVYANYRGCEFLLKSGAMVNRSNRHGLTPLEAAVISVRMNQGTQLEVFHSQQKIVEMLLESGAVIANESRDASILKMAAQVHASEIIMSLLIRQVAKEQYVNDMNIDGEDREIIESSDYYKRYHSKYLQELKNMEDTKFYKDVTVFSAFMDCEKTISCARNEKLVEDLKKNDYDHKFPIYFALLKKRFDAEVKKQRLRKSEMKISNRRRLSLSSLSNIFSLSSDSYLLARQSS